jgi:hypothetical protein
MKTTNENSTSTKRSFKTEGKPPLDNDRKLTPDASGKAPLPEWMQPWVREVARQRWQNNRDAGIVDKQIGDQESMALEVNSVGSEFAVCWVNNTFPDLNTTAGKRTGGDCVLHNGLVVDVKNTVRPDGQLLVAPWKLGSKVDWYVLVVGEFPNYRIVGGIHASKVFQDKYKGDLGHGPGYIIPQSDLGPIPLE